MKTFLSDIFPRIKKYSEKLDNLTLLTDQHWVCIDELFHTKTVYIFRSNNELIVATNGKVKKAKWDYLGSKSLLIDIKNDSYLFKHGFFDENVLALKLDSCEEYAVFVNENKYNGELNSIEKVNDFLKQKYLNSSHIPQLKKVTSKIDINNTEGKKHSPCYGEFSTDKGIIYVRLNYENALPSINNGVYQNGSIAKNGKYIFKDMSYILVSEGIIIDILTS